MLRRTFVSRGLFSKGARAKPDPTLSFTQQTIKEAGANAGSRKEVQEMPLPQKMVIAFCCSFAIMCPIEWFMCKTHLYDTIMMHKDSRRHEIDEFVVTFREDISKWQEEDMRRAELKEKAMVKRATA